MKDLVHPNVNVTVVDHSTPIGHDTVAETKLAEAKRYAEVRSGNNKAHVNKTKRRAIAAMVKKSKRRNK